MGANLDYYAVRDEYVMLSDKVKALEQTYNCMNEQLKQRVQGKSWKLKSMLPANSVLMPSNADNQNSNYRLPSETDKHIEEVELQRQLMEDLRDLFEKKESARAQVEQLRPDYKYKKNFYIESKEKLEDLLQYKGKVKDQMYGFLKMYEVKKESTLQQLSHRLQQSESFKK